MTVAFRNVDFDPASPLDNWPAEAIETVMDRGSLSDWRRLADAIRHNPWGPAARTVEAIAGWGEHYGVDALMTSVIRRRMGRGVCSSPRPQNLSLRIRRTSWVS